ncbi:YggT family protein [Sulfuricurvum sp.]|uniref:YggT family protein n=1 Tax=Sulfuricurvum sp. TaxID=2025608 RepID=UPI0019941704|nr:YggT family protein [Sulfuricurvum sp.]MBD3799067.1 YggT family protein [Campylobacterota bacterium]MBD3805917.1 YggT family protein [Sulfuricurvum sp.]
MIGGILSGIGGIVHSLVTVYIWIVIIGALLTWVRPDPYNPIVQTIYRLTQPSYDLIRRLMPTVFNGIDLAPIILIVALNVIDVILVNIINALAVG